MTEELSVVGKRLPRKEAYRKVTGQLKYYSDRTLGNMLHMKILRSPYAHANIKSIDTSKAEALKGVAAVLTYKDVPQTPFSAPDNVHILDSKVFYVGCEVAAVAAETVEIAEEATKLIDVEYEVLPVILDPEEAMKPNAPEIHPGTPNLIFGQPMIAEAGDVDAGLATADHVVEGDYSTQLQYNCPLENHGCIANWDAEGCVTIWTGTQGAHSLRQELSSALGLPEHRMRIIQCHMGGSFGEGFPTRYNCQAALLSKKTNRPVKYVGTKEEEFQWRTRHPFTFQIKTGVNQDGTINALHVKSISDGGAYFASTLGVTSFAMGVADTYRSPNLYWEAYPVYTTSPNSGAFRGYGTPQGHSALEQHYEIVAEKIGMDPLEFRKKNHVRAGDIVGGGTMLEGSEALDECIDKGAQAIGWQDKWKGFGQPYSVSGSKRRAVGMAAARHIGAFMSGADIVKITQNGHAQLLTGAADFGQGADTVLSHICAETLKIEDEDVTVVSSDTTATPWTALSVASSRTCTSGNSVKLAAENALMKLFEAAAPMLGVNPEDLDAEDGVVFVKGDPETKVTYGEVVNSLAPPVIIGTGSWSVPQDYSIDGFAAQFADVEVDTDTGEVKVLKMALAHDVGKAVNPNTVENQIEGGVASEGIGLGITEDYFVDKATGKPLNPNYLDYAIRTTLDLPELDVILVEPIEPRGPFGAKGCSEIALVPTAPAIANAVYNAIGVRITEYPISPDKVLKALGKA